MASESFAFQQTYLFSNDRLLLHIPDGAITWLVGPNGTGKTQVLSTLAERFRSKRTTAYLPARRNLGLETVTSLHRGEGVFTSEQPPEGQKEQLLDAGMVEFCRDEALAMMVAARLRAYLGRDIDVAFHRGDPRIRSTRPGSHPLSISMESAGIKNIVGLLGFIISPTYQAVIIDEPELSLHPQYQALLLREIRLAIDRSIEQEAPRTFILATHSPFLYQPKNLTDLENTFFFTHPDRVPARFDAGQLDVREREKVGHLLLRMGAHERSIFFSRRPVFVEGPTDSNFLSTLADRADLPLSADGACLVACDGAGDIPALRQLCRASSRDSFAIADLDVLFSGDALDDLDHDARTRERLDGQSEKELRLELRSRAEDLAVPLSDLGEPPGEVPQRHLKELRSARAGNRAVHVARLLAVASDWAKLQLPGLKAEVEWIGARVAQLRDAALAGGIYILSRGSIEDYYKHGLNVSGRKVQRLEDELGELMKASPEEARRDYSDLVAALEGAVSATKLDLDHALAKFVANTVHRIQMTLVDRPDADRSYLWQIVSSSLIPGESVRFERAANGGYKVEFVARVHGAARQVSFSQDTVAASLRGTTLAPVSIPSPRSQRQQQFEGLLKEIEDDATPVVRRNALNDFDRWQGDLPREVLDRLLRYAVERSANADGSLALHAYLQKSSLGAGDLRLLLLAVAREEHGPADGSQDLDGFATQVLDACYSQEAVGLILEAASVALASRGVKAVPAILKCLANYLGRPEARALAERKVEISKLCDAAAVCELIAGRASHWIERLRTELGLTGQPAVAEAAAD